MKIVLAFLCLCLSTSCSGMKNHCNSKSKPAVKKENTVKKRPPPKKKIVSKTKETTPPRNEGWPSKYKPLKSFLLEFKPAAFYYQDSTIRHIYGKFTFMAILEMDQNIKYNVHAYLAAGYARSHGKVANTADIDWLLIPISAGLKYVYPVSSYAYLYAKLGPTWFYTKSKMDNRNAYPWVKRVSIERVWGFNTGIGGLVHLGHNFYLDLFFNYLYGRDSFLDPNSNTRIKFYAGGLEFLAGLGYHF